MAIVLSLVSMLSTLLGGFVAMRIGDRKHLVLGLAAGVMLGLVAFDLIPEALEQTTAEVYGVPAVLIAAVVGFLSLHIIERAVAIHTGHEQEFGAHHHGFESVGLLAAAGLIFHSTLDGFGIGLGYQAGATVGLSVAIAVICHDFADGFNTFTIPTLYGSARKRAFTLLGLDAIAPVVGAILGTIIKVPEQWIGLYLGYFAGFLLYLATADILPEAHAEHPSRLTLLLTVLGVGAMFVVAALSH
ncbi:ZIP family metal transporter [Nocardia neocaledoniensis NBRC 108232]|uniref:ZIP family zinc transporter n=1 Tax=Nocardia neocaledoniensis TaxID=236511 RepID=A0A317NDV5_9NOCA|nr:ZIP family metal transporter [Nocardia neocaledoniensis]PWV73556.1 ZIP family zinc transporter [Nocardia neocaledoniensis]GEM29923.1 ZIP family metal transporter [Nocardia neocaledoniensis NBRC 108232]